MAELTLQEKNFIKNNNLYKNLRFFKCVKETDITLEGKEIEKNTWKCVGETDEKGYPRSNIDGIGGFFPAGSGLEIDDVILTKDWFGFNIENDRNSVFYDEEDKDYYCGLKTGNFINGKEVFHKGTGDTYRLENYLSCQKLYRWMGLEND